ncbi:hypothetical protein FKZ61_002640 [Litorilinea aerophila]|uniref:Uncharacterized protein n=1 Tax=Litorilinea aerophila TaxID=1204385 RepID=A0A540VMG7_9CHLR|nr:hypothetical protein [Litorilinea aerophila]MCC9075011.1 hypothetical protein [Litorilinea aerophila]OUC06451.1 hypothetical protein RY27_20960 [Litorilinea aerophila]
MNADSYSMSDVLSQYVATHQVSEELANILVELATNGIPPENPQELISRIKLLNRIKLWRETDYNHQSQVLDMVLYYIRTCIRDHELSQVEMDDLQDLLLLFRVREGDFYRLRRGEVVELLKMEVGRLILDGHLEEEEDFYQTQLQKVLGLSYDQYVGLTRDYVMEILEIISASPQADPRQIRIIKTAFLIPH